MPTDPPDPKPSASPTSTDSVEELYAKRHADYAKRNARDLGSNADGEDVTQTVFLALWQAEQQGQIRDPSAIVSRSMENGRVDHLRKRSARESYEAQAALDMQLLQTAADTAESAALQSERLRLLLALERQAPQAYEALYLRVVHGLSFAEVADALGVDRNRASRLLNVALLRLMPRSTEEPQP